MEQSMAIAAAHAKAEAAAPKESQQDGVLSVTEWENPPRDNKPIARWWWPGGSVEKAKCEEHLKLLQKTGFGSVEVQPFLLGLNGEDLEADEQLRTVGEPSFLSNVAFCAAKANELGMAFDVTLGSGWPGGLPTAKENAETQLMMATVANTKGGRVDVSMPPPPHASYRKMVQNVLDALGEPDTDVQLEALLACQLEGAHDDHEEEESERMLNAALEEAIAREQKKEATARTSTMAKVVEKKAAKIVSVLNITSSVQPGGGEHGLGRVSWEAPEGRWRLIALYRNYSSHFVMGGAFPGKKDEAFVVDHLSERGAAALLEGYGQKVLDACGGKVRAVFVDSFETIGELPFTEGFLQAFVELKGYDLTPHLPILFRIGGESKYSEMVDFFGLCGGPLYVSSVSASEPGRDMRVREDYEDVRSTIFQTRFIRNFTDWSRENGVEFRLQAHGGFGNFLDTYAMADIPESESLYGEGSTDFLKLASSAQHVMGRKFSGCESFIGVRLKGTHLSLEEMKMQAGKNFAAGINRFTFHGIPYEYSCVDKREWYPFSGTDVSKVPASMLDRDKKRILAGPLPMSTKFNAAYLQSEGMAQFVAMLGRISVAMSTGEPVTDVAWLMMAPDVKDAADVAVSRFQPLKGESIVTKAFRRRALTYDRVSPKMLEAATLEAGGERLRIGAGTYSALLLDPMEKAEVALMEKLVSFAKAGLTILLLGSLPERAHGWHDHEARDAAVRDLSAELCQYKTPKGGVVPLSKYVEEVAFNALKGQGCCGLFGKVTGIAEDIAVKEVELLLQRHVQGSMIEPALQRGRKDDQDFCFSIATRASNVGEIVLCFNESWSAQTCSVRTLKPGRSFSKWNPLTGQRVVIKERVKVGNTMDLRLGPAEAAILTLEYLPA